MNTCKCGNPKREHLAVCSQCFRAAPRELRHKLNCYDRTRRVEAMRGLQRFAEFRAAERNQVFPGEHTALDPRLSTQL